MSYKIAVKPAAQTQNESWKAQAFLNFYLPSATGDGRRKIGAIPLKEARNYDAALIQRLSEDPDAIQQFLSKLEVDFQLVNDPAATGANALPF